MMKFSKFFCILMIAVCCMQGKSFAQISDNSINYYVTQQPFGNCGQPSFTPTDSIYGSSPANGLTGGTGPYTYVWRLSHDSGLNFSNIPGATNPSYKPPTITQTTVYMREVYSGTDSSQSTQVTFYVAPTPLNGYTIYTETGHLNEKDYPCGTLSVIPGHLIGPAATGGSSSNVAYNWFYTTDQGATYHLLSPPSTGYDATPAPINTTTWYMRVAKNGACIDTSNFIKFVFGGISNNTITPPPVTSACGTSSFDPGSINGTVLTGYTYQWQSGPDSLHLTDIAGVTTQNYDPGPLSTTTAFRRKAITGTCFAFTNSVIITIAGSFSANTIGSTQTVDSAKIPVPLSGPSVTAGTVGASYTWEQSTDSITFTPAIGSNTSLNYQPGQVLSTLYYRRKAYSGSCSVTSNVVPIYFKSVVKPPDTSITDTTKPPPPPTCVGAPASANVGIALTRRPGSKSQGVSYDYTLAATNYGPDDATGVVVVDTLPVNVHYLSATPDIGTASISGNVVTWNLGALTNATTHQLILTVQPLTNDQIITKVGIRAIECDPVVANNNLRDTLNDPLPVFSDKWIPDIITPNGDQRNDKFVIQNITTTAFKDNQLVIFDRWGNTLFVASGYQNDWDGNGLSPGTYFYVLKINNGGVPLTYKGYITLMR